MCGIVGIIDLNNNKVHESRIKDMMAQIKHRGPDDEGTFIDYNVGFGHVRLSILDLTDAGHQPMFSNDDRYVIVYNGEIYNYIELKEELKSEYNFRTRTDTEIILAAYKKWGENCLHRFNGDWAFVIYDKVNKNIFGARDRYGIKPFYYRLNNGKLYFASEIKALVGYNEFPNYRNIFDYLIYNRTDHNNETFFKDIFKLQHGSKFSIEQSNLKISKWYSLKDSINYNGKIGINESITNFKDLFNDSISIRLRSDVPVGVCLSGGLDSSAIVSHLINDFNKKDINTFSAIYEGYEQADESEFIRLYSKELQNMHYTHPNADTFLNDYLGFIDAQSEPVASIGPYAQYKVMELAKKNVKVTIDGQGADEQLGGYHYFFGVYFKELLYQFKLLRLIKENAYYVQKHKSKDAFKYFVFYLLPLKMKSQIGNRYNGNLNRDFFTNWKNGTKIEKNLYDPNTLSESLYQHFEHKLEHLLKWEDHNSMYFSIESRVPFLDHRLVEFLLGINSNQIIKQGDTKHILREASKNILPERIRTRKDKKGFSTPSDEWFRDKRFKDLTHDIITSKSFIDRGIFDNKSVMKNFDDHTKEKSNQTKNIWKWVNLEMWFRNFID